jgi:hypothetical protein
VIPPGDRAEVSLVPCATAHVFRFCLNHSLPTRGLAYGSNAGAISQLFGLSRKFLSEIRDVLCGFW